MKTRPSIAAFNRHASASAGFTLFESAIVIILLGIVAAFVTPKAFNSGTLTLKSQARNFASELRHAQLLAITTGVPVSVSANGNRYTVQYTLNGASATPVDVTMVNDAVFTAAGLVTFDSLGQAQGTVSPLGFELKSTSNSSATVRVTAATGLVSLQ